MQINNGLVKSFHEKPKGEAGKINGGFFVLNSSVFDFIKNDETTWEKEPLMELTNKKELMAFEHEGFWQPMDTLAEKRLLNDLYNDNKAPWKSWE